MTESAVELPVVEVGPIAHGGHCVARLDGQVVFVRHALPGEHVRIKVMSDHGKYLRADAVEILQPAASRVQPPCEVAGVCGGCDFQHVAPEAQRELLTQVVREQLKRLAGIDWSGTVEVVEPEALGWRTRMTYAVDEQGRPGLRKHRSHEVVPLRDCPIAHPDLPAVLDESFDSSSVEAIASSTGDRLVITDASISDALHRTLDGVVADDGTVRDGQGYVTERVTAAGLQHDFRITGSGFWQVHPAAASTLVTAVLEAAQVHGGDTVADLYAGAGLFTAFLADRVGTQGRVYSVESHRGATADAQHNLGGKANITVIGATVEKALRRAQLPKRVDVVVLDPPRAGAKAAIPGIVAMRPRRIVYVACDPAALARDTASLATKGYRLESVRAFALFPMTHHVECVAVLLRA